MKVLRRILSITRKEIQVLFARPMERRVIMLPPLVMLFVFSYAATMDVRNVDVVLLNGDSGRWSEEFISRLDGSPTFRQVRRVTSMNEVRTALDNQDALLALVFDDRFSRDLDAMRPATFQLLLDGRRSNAALIVQGYVQTMVREFMEDTPAFKAASPAMARVEAVNWFNPNLEFQWFEVPNLMGLISMMMGFIVTGLSVARERELGTFDQMLVSPAAPLEIAIAKIIPGALIALLHGTVFVLGARFIFGVPLEGSLPLLYVSMLIFAVSVSGIGLLVSSLAATQQQAFLGAFTVALPCILFSGYASPVDNMSPALQFISQADPLRHYLVLIQGVFLRDISLDAALVPLGKMILIGAVTTTVAIIVFKRRA